VSCGSNTSTQSAIVDLRGAMTWIRTTAVQASQCIDQFELLPLMKFRPAWKPVVISAGAVELERWMHPGLNNSGGRLVSYH